MTRPACVVIDRAAARANLARVRALAPGRRLMAVIKADAYGHGVVRMARLFAGADAYGVACLEEAVRLREAGIRAPITLLEGPFESAEVAEIQALRLETVVHHEEQLRMLECAPALRPTRVWLKIDTGMHRLGFDPADVRRAWERLVACDAVAGEPVLMTHFASAHHRGDGSVDAQLGCFEQATAGLPGERCIANSAGLISRPDSHAHWVRPGLMLYGVSPFEDSSAEDEGLAPVMTLRSALISVRRVAAGEGVGYGATWRCPEPMPVGVVALGYGDGYPRQAGSGTPVLVNGVRTQVIGRASMDMITVDLRPVPQARVGDPVVFWGSGLPVEQIARRADTVPYELLCAVRVRARFVEADAEYAPQALDGRLREAG